MKRRAKIDMNIATEIPLKEELLKKYKDFEGVLGKNDGAYISALRKEAIENFKSLGFPHRGLEKWRNTNLAPPLQNKYTFLFEKPSEKIDIEEIFSCEVPDLDTLVLTQYNGWHISKNGKRLQQLNNGVVIGSFEEAMRTYPDIVKQHYGKYAKANGDGLSSLNTAFAQDGIFIYVPDNVVVNNPIQIINLINSDDNLFVQPRNLIVLGKNSKLTLIHCDHSIKHRISFINSLTEVYVDENASFDHYKLQNKDNNSALITNVYVHQEAHSNVATNTITLNGGIVRNETHVKLAGRNANADVLGLYLADKNQHVDNQVFIDHAVPNCYSNELFKGILDDEATGVFNGHIKVQKDAQKTNAFQNNKNILLTDTAKITTKPFLEIYADDVKCSHGATVGQLDPEAMFYLRSRGVNAHAARMLLMYAFGNEIVKEISIKALRERIDQMIEKRLKGELSICDQCVLNCSGNTPVSFDIDLTKI